MSLSTEQPKPLSDSEVRWYERKLGQGMYDTKRPADLLKADIGRLIATIDAKDAEITRLRAELAAKAPASVPVRIDPENPDTWPPQKEQGGRLSEQVRVGIHKNGRWVNSTDYWDYENKWWSIYRNLNWTHWALLPDWTAEGAPVQSETEQPLDPEQVRQAAIKAGFNRLVTDNGETYWFGSPDSEWSFPVSYWGLQHLVSTQAIAKAMKRDISFASAARALIEHGGS